MFLGESVVNVSVGGVNRWKTLTGAVLTVLVSGRYRRYRLGRVHNSRHVG